MSASVVVCHNFRYILVNYLAYFALLCWYDTVGRSHNSGTCEEIWSKAVMQPAQTTCCLASRLYASHRQHHLRRANKTNNKKCTAIGEEHFQAQFVNKSSKHTWVKCGFVGLSTRDGLGMVLGWSWDSLEIVLREQISKSLHTNAHWLEPLNHKSLPVYLCK